LAEEQAQAATGAVSSNEDDKPTEVAPVPVEEMDEAGLRQEVARLNDVLREKEAAAVDLREQVLRAHADFENFRRRQQKSLEDDTLRARERVVANHLPLLDNLERAVNALTVGGDLAALSEGVRLILRQMNDILAKEGVSPIESDGKLFDPNLHEVVTFEDRDDVPDHTVLETFQRGYKLGERTLRPSMVKVSRGGPQEGPQRAADAAATN
jgi:molecular chaperone GrpE